MSTRIPPDDTVDLDDGTVLRYSLPKLSKTAFWIETCDSSYSVKWEVPDEFGPTEFGNFISEFSEKASDWKAVASFENLDEGVEGPLGEVMNRLEDPDNCTYLRVEAEEFDLEWLEGSYTNRVVLSSTFEQKKSLLREVINRLKTTREGALLDRHYDRGIEQVESILEGSGTLDTRIDI